MHTTEIGTGKSYCSWGDILLITFLRSETRYIFKCILGEIKIILKPNRFVKKQNTYMFIPINLLKPLNSRKVTDSMFLNEES